jgi:cytochrome c5
MKRILAVGLIVSTVALIAVGVITLYDYNLSIGRMWQTPAIKPHEKPIPVMAAGSVPVTGGEALYRTAVAETITPTFLLTEPAAIAAGKTAYQRYCIQCHGQKFDGYGTVGQSFAPPPGDLRSKSPIHARGRAVQRDQLRHPRRAPAGPGHHHDGRRTLAGHRLRQEPRPASVTLEDIKCQRSNDN